MDNNTAVQQLIEKIIIEGRLQNLPETEMTAFKKNMEEQINRKIGLTIIENLSDEGVAEYEALMDDELVPNPQKLQSLLEKDIPDFQEKLKISLDEFMQEVISAAQ